MKNQIEELAATRKDFPELITAAQHWLLARETSVMAAGDGAQTSQIVLTMFLVHMKRLRSDFGRVR